MKINKQIIDRLCKVLSHVWSAEEKHYKDCEPIERQNHIFKEMVMLRRWAENLGGVINEM